MTINELDHTRRLARAGVPEGGWLRAVRKALGLSMAQLARRLSLTPAAIPCFEKAEASGAISLRSLRRVAEAMDCELVVRLVPRGGRSFRDLARKEGAVIVSDSTIQEEKVLEEPAVHSWSQVTESHLL